MCSTCNYRNYEIVKGERKTYLESSLGYGSLVIRCDEDGTNYRLAVKNEPKSEFTLYACPTCRKALR